MTAGYTFPRTQEVFRKDWMFKLVGKETFTVGSANTRATIVIEAISGFAYEYTLEVGGKSLEKFIANRAQTTKTWLLKVDDEDYRIVLGESGSGGGGGGYISGREFAPKNVGDTLRRKLLGLRLMQVFMET